MEKFEFDKSTGIITKYIGEETNVTIPSEIDGFPVISIGHRTFMFCKSIKSISIPDSVTSIGESAFAFCESLKSVSLPGSVDIEPIAFWECPAKINHR